MSRNIVLDTNCLVQIISARSPYTRMFDPHFRFGLIEQDPDDNKFVDCAIIAGADYIVSEDAHFRILETIPFPSVNVRRLEEFLLDLQE